MRVIVVDDDKDTVAVFSEFLELNNIEVVGKAYDGKEAVELYEKVKPDIVLLDIMMPVYDGFYAFDKIRKMDTNSKIIVVTADLNPKTRQQLKDQNATGIFFKPYDIDKIVGTIHSIKNGGTVFLSL